MKKEINHHPKPKSDHYQPGETEGTVVQYLLNPRGEVDGLLLKEGAVIKFPPHLGRELTQVARPGDSVKANGHFETPESLKGHVIVNAKTGLALREMKPAPPERANGLDLLQPANVRGKIARLKMNAHGDADGAILADGTVLHFPPHVGKQFASLLVKGETICGAGFGVTNDYGKSVALATLGASAEKQQAIAPPPPKPKK